MKAKETEETPEPFDMSHLVKALSVVKAKKAALDASILEMQQLQADQQQKIDAAQAAHAEAQRAAALLHDEFGSMVASLLPTTSRTRTA